MTGATMRRARVAVLAAALGAMAATLTAAPAAAADSAIAISPDGVTYADAYAGALFDGVMLVPAGTSTRPFWVRNTGESGGHLAIAILDAGSADPAFLSSLSMSADAGGHGNGPVAFDAVGGCTSLVQGVHLEPGQSIRVDAELAMANVGGTTAQGAEAWFDVVITLTSDAAPAPDGCVTPVLPPRPPAPGGDGGTGVVVVPGLTPPTSIETDRWQLSPAWSVGDAVAADRLPRDAGRITPEWLVLAWVTVFATGVLWMGWRRRRGDEPSGS